jgi:hypothetical protein
VKDEQESVQCSKNSTEGLPREQPPVVVSLSVLENSIHCSRLHLFRLVVILAMRLSQVSSSGSEANERTREMSSRIVWGVIWKVDLTGLENLRWKYSASKIQPSFLVLQ